jgi:hypothetical protein
MLCLKLATGQRRAGAMVRWGCTRRSRLSGGFEANRLPRFYGRTGHLLDRLAPRSRWDAPQLTCDLRRAFPPPSAGLLTHDYRSSSVTEA